jgi:hypothetical protein
MLFKRTAINTTPDTLTPTEAKQLYARLIAGENENDLFKTGTPFEYSAQVIAEAKRIEAAVIAYMSDEPGTEAQLRATISSDLLTVATVVTDVRVWSDGNPDESPNWETYKATFTNLT